MDIAIIGPEKFQFQDVVCIEVALSYRVSGPFTLIPEPKGGEDASLQWLGPNPTVLEIQIKGAKGVFDLTCLARYLLHYPPQSSSGCLLQRLMEDDERHALFVVTARCTDDLVPLLYETPLRTRPAARAVSSQMAQMLKSEIGRLSIPTSKKNTKLKERRRENAAALATRTVTDFERALAKVGLLEQQTAEAIEVRLHAMLQAERFDTLSIRGVLARFSDILSHSKRSQSDALQPILNEVAARSPVALRPSQYYDRGIENELESRLNNDRALLLAGPPRAGKSWTARAIGGRLQQQGYEVRRGLYIDEAERFLTDSVGASRAYILDDPLGSREPHSDASARLATLRALCQHIPANRRLIVAQSEQVLLQANASSNLEACKLNDVIWQRLEPLSIDIAIAIWRDFANSQSILTSDIDRIANLIAHESRLRDPGALVYLAQTWEELRDNASVEEILLQARKDAADFARSLAERMPGVRDVLVASALATTHSESAALQEIAFIINGDQERPGLVPDGEGITLLGQGPTRPPPAYAVEQRLSADQQTGLDTLQRRRLLARVEGRFNFTHPYLRAGAQTLAVPDIPEDLERIQAQLERAIASASPVTSLSAARNLRWLRSALRQGDDYAVFAIARIGAQSVFPATRDACFDFLIDSASMLPSDIREQLPSLSEEMVLDIERINIKQGVGFLSDAYDFSIKVSPLEDIRPYLEAMELGQPLNVDLALARRLLQSLELHPEALTHEVLLRFLHADEAVVRASAAKIWLALERQGDEEILQRITNDGTPSMSTAILKALQFNWTELSEQRQNQVIAILGVHARLPSCASVLFSRLVLLNRHNGTDTPWRIFTTLMPIAIDCLPLAVSFSNGRLYTIVSEAVAVVPTEDLFPVLDRWAKRLLRRADHYLLSEYEIAIADPLLKIADASRRLPIIQGLFGVRDTGVRALTTRILIDNWSDLSRDEHAVLEGVLRDGREDTLWLHAIALTAHRSHGAVIALIAGDATILEQSTESIEQVLGTELFSACVHTYVGWPQPLWWYGTHHSRNPIWIRVLRDLAKSSDHPLQEVAFYEVANLDENELVNVIHSLPDSSITNAFDWLLNFKISRVGDWRTEAWQGLLVRAEQLQLLDKCLQCIDEVIEGILEDLDDIEAWLGTVDTAKRVQRLLPNDWRAIRIADKLARTRKAAKEIEAEVSAESIPSHVLEEIFSELSQKALEQIDAECRRIAGTWNVLRFFFDKAGAHPETLAALESRRLAALDRHRSIRERFRGCPPDFSLLGWVEPFAEHSG